MLCPDPLRLSPNMSRTKLTFEEFDSFHTTCIPHFLDGTREPLLLYISDTGVGMLFYGE